MKILLAALLAGTAWAQPVTVYSDLAEIDASGKVTAPETPREILSPALIRNGFTSFQVVVQVPADKKWWLFIGQNPADSVKVTMYRESAGKLDPVDLPRQSSGTEVLWMDVWADRNAPIARIKLEPELMIDDDWLIYPIEARVMEAAVPDGPKAERPLCNAASPKPDEMSELMNRRYRNMIQDAAIAQRAPKGDLGRVLTSCEELPRDGFLSEEYLKIRDYLFRLR